MEVSLKKELINIVDNFDEKEIKEIYNFAIDINNKKKEISVKQMESTLIFLNSILKFLNKPEITNILEFVNIDRDDLLKEECIEILNKNYDTLFKLFDPYKCGNFRKTKNIVINTIRGICKNLGYSFISKKKDKFEKQDGKTFRLNKVYYFIVNL